MNKTCENCDWREMGICKCPYTKFRGMPMGDSASCISFCVNRDKGGDAVED